MTETGNLSLPLLASGQAQKHVTLNDALSRLDLLVMLAVKSRTVSTPPAAAQDGDRYAVSAGASGAWAGREGRLAVFQNGGWEFLAPSPGWRAFVEDEGADAIFANGIWTSITQPVPPPATLATIIFDHAVSAGAAQSTFGTIPAGALVFGVTARVMDEVKGPAAWSLGVVDAPSRYGAGHSVGLGESVRGARATPLAYLADTALRLSPEGGEFAGGRIRFCIHYLELAAPPV